MTDTRSAGPSEAGPPAAVAERWLAERRAVTEQELADAREAVENLSAQLRAAVARLHELRQRERALDGLDPAELARDAELVRELPGVAGVDVTADGLAIRTGPIAAEGPDGLHDLGSFVVRLSPRDGVRVFAAEPPADAASTWIHPHVQADRPCLGPARVGVEKLLGDVQLLAAAQVMLRFLTTYDPATAYVDIGAWPNVAG